MNYRKSFEKIKDKIEKEEVKEQFINLCNEVMDTSTIYDRRLYKEEFKKFIIKVFINSLLMIIFYQIL